MGFDGKGKGFGDKGKGFGDKGKKGGFGDKGGKKGDFKGKKGDGKKGDGKKGFGKKGDGKKGKKGDGKKGKKGGGKKGDGKVEYDADGVVKHKGANGAYTKCSKAIQAGEAKVYTGFVKCYYGSKDIGFMTSEMVAEERAGDGDVFCFGPNMKECNCGVGDEVAFILRINPKGQAQAQNPFIRIRHAEPDLYALVGIFRLHQEKGCGFIACNETTAFWGKDPYVHKKHVDKQGLQDGDTVAFNLTVNFGPGANGEGKSTNVSDIVVVDRAYVVDPGILPDDPKAVRDRERQGLRAVPKKPGNTGKAMVGIIESYDKEMDYARIRCRDVRDMFGTDCFCSGEEMGEFKTGTMVCFELFISDRLKPQAVNLMPADRFQAVEHVHAAGGAPPADAGDIGGHDLSQYDPFDANDADMSGNADGGDGEWNGEGGDGAWDGADGGDGSWDGDGGDGWDGDGGWDSAGGGGDSA